MSELIEIENDQDGMIEINSNRLDYLLDLFDLSKEDLVEKLNEGRKRLLAEDDVSGETLKLSVLKRIDKILKQGLNYYTDSIDPPSSKNERSILFRKSEFNADIKFADRLQVYKTERQIVRLSALAKLSEYPKLTRKLQIEASLDDIPKDVAKDVGDMLYPEPSPNPREFLEQLINKLAESDIFVFEYIETWNQINKTTIDGFFISPNAIAIKRQQHSFTREIFTLAHELGHYILRSEELDKPVLSKPEGHSKEVEYWCNAFAFAFLVSEENRALLYKEESPEIDSEIIKYLVKNHHVSRLAVFTHLALGGKITWQRHAEVKRELKGRYAKSEEERKKENERKRQLAEERGEKLIIPPAKPIYSELEKDIYRNAYLDGVIGEYAVLKNFRTKDIDEFVYG